MKRLLFISLSVFMSITMADCGPGKLISPTFTPTPTETLTPTDTPTFTPTITQIPTEIPTVTATKEPEIGGTTAVTVWKDVFGKTVIPSEFSPYLTPTSPEQWASLKKITMSDGNPIPLGGAITYLDVGDTFGKWPLIPGLVRGVVEYGKMNGLPVYGVIIEFPVKGGSIFYIGQVLGIQINSDYPTSELIPGAYPVECAGGVTCTGDHVYIAIKASDGMNASEVVSLLQSLVGKIALFPMRPIPEDQDIINAIAHGSKSIENPQVALDMPEIWYQP